MAPLKDKLIEDTSFIATQQQTVIPDRLNEVKKDFEDTWHAIEDQVCCVLCVPMLDGSCDPRSMREDKRPQMQVISSQSVVPSSSH